MIELVYFFHLLFFVILIIIFIFVSKFLFVTKCRIKHRTSFIKVKITLTLYYFDIIFKFFTKEK